MIKEKDLQTLKGMYEELFSLDAFSRNRELQKNTINEFEKENGLSTHLTLNTSNDIDYVVVRILKKDNGLYDEVGGFQIINTYLQKEKNKKEEYNE